MSQPQTPQQLDLRESSILRSTPSFTRARPQVTFSAFPCDPSTPVRQASSARARSVTTSASRRKTNTKRMSMVPRMRVPVREGDDDDEGPAAPDVKGESPDLYSTSPFRGASPSIVSMGRAGSVTSEVMPQAPDIQHLEGELWYVTGKSIPGKKKHATAQWVVCEDNHLSVYSSWAQSSRQLEEKQFERVRILFDFLHPHKHADTVGGSVPQTRRLTLQRNQPRTTAESRVIFDMRDPLRGKSLAGYYYFGIECIIRDAATGKLRRFLEIFCTDRADDHRKWISFWEEMQLRYPMVRNRDANATSMELSSEWLENFVFPHASAKSPPQSSSEVNSSHMLSFIDDDHFSATRAPRSGAAPPNASCTPINSPTSVLSQLKAGLSSGEGRSSLARLPESASALHGGAAVRRNLFSVTEAAEQSRDVLLLSLAETERAMRESVECAEMALRGMLMAHCTLRSLAVRTLHEAELPQTTFLENVVVRSDGGDSSKQSKVDKAGDRPSADRDIIDELQAELKALCGALEQKQALPEVTTVDATPAKADHDGSTATNDVWKSPDAAVVSAATLADYERQLAEVRDENARLREEFKGLAGAAVERVEAAFAMWTETGLSESPAAEAETAPAREQHALNQLYLSADDTLVRALVDVAVDREGTTAISANTSKTEYFENSVAHHTSPPSTAPPFNSSGLSPLNAEFETEAISNLEIEEQKAEGGDCADHRANDAPHAPPLLHGIVRNLQHLETSRVPCGADRPSLPLLIRQQLRHFSLEHVRRLGTTAPRACSTTNLITTSGATPLTASATDAPSTASVEGGTAAALVDPFLQQVVESCIDVFSSLISPSVGATPSSISPVTPAAAEGCGAEDTKEPAVVSTWLVALRECLHRHRERTSLSASDAAAVAGGPTSASKHHDSEGAAAAICVDASAPAAASGGTPHSSFSTQHLPSPRPSSSVEYAAVEESSAIVAEIRHQGREVVQWIQSIQRDERNLKIYVNAVASFTAANAAFQAKQHGTQEPPTTIGVSAPATQTEEKENGRDDVSHATDSKSESDKQLERNTAIAPLAALEKTHHLLARVQNAAQNMKDERTDADSLRRAFLEVSYGPLGLTAANAWLVTRQDEIEGAQIQPGRSTSHIKGASSMQHDRARDGWRAALNTDAVRDRAMSLIGHISLVAALDRLLLTLGRSPTAALQNPWRESGVAPSDTPAESILGLCEQQQQRMKEEEKLSTQLLGRLTEVSALVRWNEAEKGIPAALRAATAVVRAAEERQDLAAKDSNATWLDYEKHKALLAQSYAISAAHETQPNRDSGHPPKPAEEQTENTGAILPHYFDKLEVTQLQLREAQQSRVHAIKKALELTAAALHKGTSEDTPRIPTYKDTDLRAVARALGVAEDAYGGSGEGDERAPTVEQLVARAEELATAAARADKAVTDAEALRAAVEGALGPLPGDDGDALLAAKRAELEAAEAELAAAKGKKARDAAQARVAGLRGEVGSLEASEAERAASGAADYAAAVGERLRDLVQHDERVDNSDKTEPQVTTQHAHVLDGDEWGAVVRDRPAAARDALAGDVSAACHVGAADVSDVAFGPDGRHASFGVTHNAGVSEEELNRRLEAYGFPRMHALYERRGAAPDGADAALAELATATAEHAEELRAVARALGVAEDAYGGSGEGDERAPTVEQLVARAEELATAAARADKAVTDAEALRAAVEGALGPLPGDDGDALLAAKRAELEAAEAELAAAKGKKARDAAQARVAGLRGEVGSLEASEAERAASGAADYAAAVGERLRDLVQHDERVDNSDKTEPQVTTQHAHVLDGDEWGAVVRDRPAAARDALAGDVSAACHVGAADVSDVAFGPDGRHASFGVTHNAGVSEEELNRRLEAYGFPRMHALYERRGAAPDGADAALAELATATAEHAEELRAVARALGVAEDAYGGSGEGDERAPTVEQLVARAEELATAAARADKAVTDAEALRAAVEGALGPLPGDDGDALLAAKRAELEAAEAELAAAKGKKARDAAQARVAGLRGEVGSLEASEAERAASGAADYAAAVGERLRDLVQHDERVDNSDKTEPQVTTQHAHVLDGDEWGAVVRDRPAAARDALAGDVSAACHVGAADVSDVAFGPDGRHASFGVTHNAGVSEEELNRRLEAYGFPRMHALYERRGAAPDGADAALAELATATAEHAEELRAVARALGVAEDAYGGSGEGDERAPTVEQLVARAEELATAAARADKAVTDAEALRAAVEGALGPLPGDDGDALLAAKRAELEAAEAELAAAKGKKARDAAQARVAGLRGEVGSLEASEAERAASGAADYAAAVGERLRDLVQHDERVDNSDKTEPQVTTQHAHVLDGDEWGAVVRDRPAAARDALAGDVSAACHVGAADVSDVAFGPDGRHASFGVTHNAGVSEEELNRRLEAYGFPRMHALYERRGAAPDGADAALAELATATAEHAEELRAVARALGVAEDAYGGSGEGDERAPTVEQLVARAEELATAAARADKAVTDAEALRAAVEGALGPLPGDDGDALLAAKRAELEAAEAELAAAKGKKARDAAQARVAGLRGEVGSLEASEAERAASGAADYAAAVGERLRDLVQHDERVDNSDKTEPQVTTQHAHVLDGDEWGAVVRDRPAAARDALAGDVSAACHVGAADVSDVAFGPDGRHASFGVTHNAGVSEEELNRRLEAYGFPRMHALYERRGAAPDGADAALAELATATAEHAEELRAVARALGVAEDAYGGSGEGDERAPTVEQLVARAEELATAAARADKAVTDAEALRAAVEGALGPLPGDDGDALLAAKRAELEAAEAELAAAKGKKARDAAQARVAGLRGEVGSLEASEAERAASGAADYAAAVGERLRDLVQHDERVDNSDKTEPQVTTQHAHVLDGDEWGAVVRDRPAAARDALAGDVSAACHVGAADVSDVAFGPDGRHASFGVTHNAGVSEEELNRRLEAYGFPRMHALYERRGAAPDGADAALAELATATAEHAEELRAVARALGVAEDAYGGSGEGDERAPTVEQLVARAEELATAAARADKAVTDAEALRAAVEGALGPLPGDDGDALLAAKRAELEAAEAELAAAKGKKARDAAQARVAGLRGEVGSLEASEAERAASGAADYAAAVGERLRDLVQHDERVDNSDKTEPQVTTQHAHVLDGDEWGAVVRDRPAAARDALAGDVSAACHVGAADVSDVAFGPDGRHASFGVTHNAGVSEEELNRRLEAYGFPRMHALYERRGAAPDGADAALAELATATAEHAEELRAVARALGVAEDAYGGSGEGDERAPTVEQLVARAEELATAAARADKAVTDAEALRAAVEGALGPLPGDDGDALLAAKRAELEAAEAELAAAKGKKARDAAQARVAGLRGEVGSLEASEAERAASGAADYAAAVGERLRDLVQHDERVDNSDKTEPQVTTQHAHVLDGDEWGAVVRDRPAAARDALAGDVSAACHVGAADVSDVAFGPDGRHASFGVTHNAGVSEEELNRRLEAYGFPRMHALYERRGAAPDGADAALAELATATAEHAEELRAVARALGVAEDAYGGSGEGDERAPTVEQLVARAEELATAAARADKAVTDAEALRAAVEGALGPLPGDDGDALLAAKRAELEAAEAELAAAKGKKARDAAQARVAGLRGEVGSLEASEAERAASGAADYAAAVGERLRDLVQHDERVDNSDKTEPQVTTQHAHVLDGDEWGAVVRDRPAAARDALAGDVSAACHVGAADVSDVAFGPDGRHASFGVTHNAGVSEEELNRRLEAYGFPRMHALYERRGAAPDGADAALAELATATAEHAEELRAVARALGVAEDAYGGSGEGDERAPTVEQLVARAEELATAAARADKAVTDAEALRAAVEGALGPLPGDDGDALLAAKRAELEAAEAELAAAKGKKARDAAQARVAGLRGEVGSLEASEAERAASGAADYAAAVGERLRDLVQHDERVDNSDKTEPQVTTQHAHVLDGDEWGAVVRDRPAAARDALAGDVSAACHVGAADVSDVAFGPDGRHASFGVTHNAGVSEEELNRRLEAYGFPRMHALYERRGAAPDGADAALAELATATAEHAEELRAVARALGVAEDAYGGSGEGDERAPTVEQLVARAEELATAAARADKAVTDAEALRAAVEGALGPLPGDDGDALLAAKRAELEAAEAELAAAKGKKARDAAQARVAGLRGEVGSLEASEAERAASGAADYAAAVGERLRDLVQHDERVDNSDKTEPQVTTQHAHVLDGDEWGAVVRDRPAAARDALAGDVSAACHVGAADVSDVAFGPDGRHASFGVTHNAGVSEEELNRRLEAYGFPRMHALYERRGAAPDGADAALAELATATAEHAEELRAVARALGVAEDAYGGSGEGDERAPTVEQLVARAEELATAAARADKAVTDAEALRAAVEGALGPLPGDDGDALLAAKRAELEAAEAELAAAKGKKARDAAQARVAGLRGEVGSLEASEAERAASGAADYAAAVGERLRDLVQHDERVDNSDKTEPQVTTQHAHVLDGDEWGAVVRDRPAAARDALAGDVSAACHVGAADVSDVAFGPDGRHASFGVTHNAGVSEEELNRRLEAYGFPRMHALYERRGAAPDGADAALAELATATAEHAEELRAVARALGVAEDAYGGSGEGDERAPTVEQLVARAEELATAAARADKAVTDAEALRAAVEGALGPLPGDDGDALLAAKRAELEAAEAELAAAKGKKARDAAQARVAGLRGEVGSLEASEAERAASGAADYAAAVGERLRDLVQHDERVDNSDKTEPQVTTQHAHVLDGDEWGAVVRDRPAAARDALAGDVSAACHVGAADVSDVAFGPDGRHASFGVTHNAGVSEEELNRRLEAYGFPRMHALYERRGAAPDGADAALAELATATAEHAEELRAVARALGVAEDAYGGSGEGDERGCSVEVLVGAAVGLRKLVSMFGAEYEEACSLLKRLDVAVECAVVHVEHRETGWFDASGAGRWVVAQHCVDSLSAALLTSRAELCELRDSVKTYVDQLEDVKLDEAKLQETVAAAVEKLRAGLGDGELSVSDCVSPLSSRGSAVCGSLFCSLRDLVSEVSEVSLALRKVKTALEEPTTELKSHPVAAKLSFPLAAEGAEVNEGRVVTYQDVVAGVGARIESLRKERLGRLRSEQALRGIAEEVAARTASTDGQWSYGVRRGLSTASPRSLQPKMKPPGAEETGSAGEGSTSRLRPSLSKEAEGDASMSETEDCAQKVLAAFAQMDDVARAMRAAMLTSYEALGGEKKLAEASDQHAAMLLTELATVTGESIEAMRALLSPGEGDSSKRISLSALLESITAKLRADPSSLPVNVTAAVEVAAQASAFREMASCSLPSTGNSSLVRHVARKRKPDPPECARTETFVLKKLLHSRDGSPYASTPFTLQVPLPPSPQGRPITAADFEKQYVYKLEEVDALRRGCAFALGLLDPCGASQDDLGSSELILQLVQRCTSVQHAMEAVHPLFDEAAMMEEVRNAFAANKNLNVDAREEVFPTQCVVLVRVVRALKNAYEEMRASRANAMKQQKFLIDNEQQNTRELREALAEVEDELQQSEQRQAEMQLAAQTAKERASSLETALEVAAQEKACLQETQNDAERALAELQNQNVGLAEQLAMAKERAAAQSESLALLEGIVGEAVDIVQGDVTEAQDALHWRVLGKHAAPLPSQRGCAAHEMLLPALRSIVDGLRECAAGLESVAVDGKAVRAVVAEQQAATRQLRRADDDAHADELDRLERTLRSQDVTAAEETAAHQRLLRQVQNAAAEELASMQQRLERVMRAQKEEETARLDAEGVSRGLRTALSDAEAAQARLQRHAAEVEAQEAEESRKARVALTSVEEQLRMARGELADVCAALATAPSAPPAVPSLSAGGEQTTSWSAAEMLTHHLAYARELRGFVETRQASERQRRARSVQSDDVVAQTLAAFQSLWATAVEAKATPANVKDEWLTPKDKAEVLQGLLLRDFTPQLSDLAAARRLLLNYVSRPTVRRFVRVAVAAGASASTSVTSVALPPPLDSAPTALLVQLYHSALHDAHDARTAELEKEVRESRRDLEAAQQQLREVEEQHELDVAEVELRIGHMREMVQSKLMADEVTEQQTRETEAAMEAHLTQLHAFAAERADMMRHVQELRRLIRKKLRGKSR